MVRGVKTAFMALTLMVILLPSAVEAQSRNVHNFACSACHRAGVSFTSLGTTNMCINCHKTDRVAETMVSTGAQLAPKGIFESNDASDAMGNATGATKQTSHHWGLTSDINPAAGAESPSLYAAKLNGRYGISRGKVICSRCHEPHGKNDIDSKILKVNNDADQLCRDCHRSWVKSPIDHGLLSHPMVADYATVATANPENYRATILNVGQGDIRLVGSGVSCTSCHAPHFADSDSATVDGKAQTHTANIGYVAPGLSAGDGFMLRSDGPYRTGGTRNDTAQLRSNLCQACHKMELHGQTNQMLGCLDCHGGHSYNGGTPSAYILRSQSMEPLPTRLWVWNGIGYDLTYGTAAITFGEYTAGGSTRTKWADDVEGTAVGMCEQCHGDVNGGKIKTMAAEHEAGDTNECTACHRHNDPADIYSFNRDASAVTCGQCHGFPPYLNVPGDRQLVPANDGGYAENNSADQGTPYDYNDSGHFKNETQTGHKVHAGADLPTSPAGSGRWYFVGNAGVDNCKVCHGPDAGKVEGGHRIDPVTDSTTFRDMFFDGIAETGGMVPSYDFATTFTCDSVYCHTNGAPYNGASRPNRDFTGTHVTPPWVGDGSSYAAGGYGSIFLQADRCAKCHGNDPATFTSQSNTPAHAAHLGGTTTLNMGIVFGCEVCHVDTATDADTLVPGSMDGRTGGNHINGLIDVDFQTGSTPNTLPEALSTSTYTPADGTCSTYCHNVTGAAGAFVADWDLATDMQCDSCHGGLISDIAGNGGYGPITSGSHLRHITTTADGGPGLSCDDCHGLNSQAGTHAAHLDGIIDVIDPVDGVSFASICEECHGYDAEVGEVLPVWGNPATTDCATCHAGQSTSTGWVGAPDAPGFMARSAGHGRLPASGNYPASGNAPADSNCLDCHLATDSAHFSGGLGDTLMLRTDAGFPANYAVDPDAFCANCHGTSPLHPTKSATLATRNITTHAGKQCVACHNLHGTTNIQMVYAGQTTQNTKDSSGTSQYTGGVAFFATSGADSYDEDDGALGGAGEMNGDDICATCHTVADGVTHNNSDNSNVDHYQGDDCFTCHGTHQADANAFKVGVGTACNDCHGFPPATAAHVLHAKSTSNDKDGEDRTDCAFCHTGANLFTYDLSADQAAGGAQANHAKGQTARRTVLGTAVGYETTNFTCATACHASTLSNGGRWSDTTGLACDACHYYAAAPTSAGNAGDLSLSHDEHFDFGKLCVDCHTLDDGALPVAGPLAHIDDISGANEGAMYQGMAIALLDEAAVVRTNMVFNDTENTCSGSGVAAGCHATGTPDWDIAIPPTGAGCLECHTDTDTAAFNPVSGLHDNNPLPTVTGNAHDGSFDDGSGGTADCITCHTATPSATHIDGTLDTGAAVTVAGSVGYNQANGTCATVCHSAGTAWDYLWDLSAYNTDGTECANCHGDYSNGWVTGVAPHTEFPARGAQHNNTGNLTYPCTDCHAIGSASGYNWTSKWDPTGLTSNHGDDKITMNQTAINTFVIDTAPNPDRIGCTTASCHGNDAAHNFTVKTTAFVTDTVTGDNPSVLCSTCHGGTPGTNASGYWPDGTLNEDTAGAHAKHMAALATSVYGESIAQLLTDNTAGNPALTSDAKQKHLCAYCHTTPGADADHGLASNLPAEVNSMYAMWDLTLTTPDNGVYSAVADTCATVDCHFNKTTPEAPTDFGWYGAQAGTCVMCHVDVTAETAHTAHTGAATLFGRSIGCADCHEAATDWAGNAAPATGHFDGSYTIAGSVTFTYDGGKSCGTNDCHEDGLGNAPKTNPYPWDGGALGNCTICHDAAPTTSTHPVHNASSYVGSCDDCHVAATSAGHIDNSVSYNPAIISASAGVTPNVTCTNTCHGGATAQFDATPTIGCLDCHSGTYVGGNNTGTGGANYLPQYSMHLLTPTVTGAVHDQTLAGAGGSCTFCHDSLPAAGGSHGDGIWIADTGANTDRGMFASFTDGTPATCTTACHSVGTVWAYKWSATVANSDGTECANCHGDYTSGWVTGVAPHTENAGRGSKHNSTGNLTYPCSDCHAIGSAGYNWTTKWDPAGLTSHHGDDKITMNQTANAVFAIDTVPEPDRAGCTTTSCHQNDALHNFRVTTTALTTQTVTGNEPSILCSSCHGGTVGTNANGYWPDGTIDEDTAGAHPKHMTALATSVYGESIAQLLTNNGNGTSDAKQKHLCAYCHTDPGADGDHGLVANLPAEVNSMYAMWDTTLTTPDNGVYSAGADTCATVDCHFNKTTPDNTFGWYDAGNASACVMCHVDVTAESIHTVHTGAATLFGRTIGCADCHDSATDWAGNVAPAVGHFDNVYEVAGGSVMDGTTNVYAMAGDKSCGTNECHEDGLGNAPKTNPYPWNGGALGNCTICHDAAPTTGTHPEHNSSSYVASCDDCHVAATNAGHIDNSVSYNPAIISASAGTTPNVTCTNTCHGGAAAEFDGTPTIGCIDCHSGTYVGGNNTGTGGANYLPQYSMHLLTPTVTGAVHDQTLAGAGGDCVVCHDSLSALTHIDGNWIADTGANTDRGMFAGFTDGTPATCTTSCHSAGTSWAYKWSATVANSDGTECANCHGDYASGWTSGVGHAVNPTRGNSSTHNDAGTLTYECTACHVIGATTGNYPWTTDTNDWASEGTTLHGDGVLQINSNGTSSSRHEAPVGTWKSGCAACHDGASNDGIGADNGNYDYPVNLTAPSTPRWTYATILGDEAAVGGGCAGCHGDGGPGNFWPSGAVAPNRVGKHLEHVMAIAAHLPGGDTLENRNLTCSYCHPDPGGSGHNDGGDAEIALFKNILTGAQTDPNGVLNAGSKTCSTVDCHFNNAVTPHWYADTFPPAQVVLTAVAGNPAVDPRAIKVSWTSPGDDDNVANTTIHHYDMRYATNSTDAADFARTDNYVGGLPLAYTQGTPQEVLVDNLTPGATYYFSLRSQDEAGNWSTPSAVVSAVAGGDTVKPYFGGVNRARKGDESATINVEWSHAEDHTMPVTYNLWMKPASSGALDMDVDLPTITGIKGYKYQLSAADGVVNDMEYFIGVRACDGVTPTPNCDSNTEIVSVTPTDIPQVAKSYHVYRANGAAATGYIGMERDAAFATAATSAIGTGLTFRPAANLAYPTTFFADSFSLFITNGNALSTIRATLGTSTGANFTSLGVSAEVTMSNRATGIKTFKFSDLAGKQLAAGQRIAVQITLVSGTVTSVGWGSAANSGALVTAERAVNVTPTNPNLLASVSGASVNMTWTQSTDTADALADEVHYDLYGSDDNGATWHYKIAHGVPAATTSYSWNTQLDGIALSAGATVAVRIKAGDGYGHTASEVTGLTVNNSTDNVAPNAINDLVVKRRAKSGSVILRWTAPGDDLDNNGRAAYYDVRYSTAAITELNFASATHAYGSPTPGFGGHIEEMEIATLVPLTNYYFAIKTYDEGGNGSAISTPKYTVPTPTDQEIGGPRCGMCHTTAPSVVESVGNHRIHGITIDDCTQCHGSQVTSFGLDHQDGLLLMGWGGNAHEALIDGTRVYYTDTGTAIGNVLYDDPDGGGGFYNDHYNGIGDGVDDGTCMNFTAGCHGPAGTPGYGVPNWISTAKLNCADCHGVPSRTTDTSYNRAFDATNANGGVVTEQVKGSPPIDNHGYDGTGSTEAERKYVGQHEKHLNYSFRFSKGDSCNLCHPGRYSDKNDLDGKHGDGYIDVTLDHVAAGEDAVWIPGTATTAGSCSNMDPFACHPTDLLAGGTAPTPKWDSTQSFDCVLCHGFNGTTPSHVTDTAGGVSAPNNGYGADPMAGNCTYCHFGGHPRDDVGGTSLILSNSSQVGINYRSGGIHLRKSIGGRAAVQTEAELCWQCHDANNISEWGTDTGTNNAAVRAPNNNNYNFGTLSQSNWVGATWTSGNANFGYKTAAIQSTHSTHPQGTSAVTSNRFRNHSETLDAVGNIRCSNCHDVHNLNLAPGDELSGQPYLRGTWLSNPYKEDGAPRSGMTYTSQNAYGAVPRGGTAYVQDGGYFIDQNSGNPTSGYSLATSAGLCTLCHGYDVDNMDMTSGENLWLGTNGHSNAAIGGTGSWKINIFDTGTGTAGGFGAYSGRPTPVFLNSRKAETITTAVPDMGYQIQFDTEGHGYRGTQATGTYTGGYTPTTNPGGSGYAFRDFDWGVSVDAGTIDAGYHAFSCSKCHNPHASRLPKLMITNCLDVRQNTWDDANPSQTLYTNAGLSDQGKKSASYDSAQNCHRLNVRFSVTATNISFLTGPDRIQSGTAIFTAANGYRVGDRVQITGGVNAGKVGTISSLTTTVLTLSNVTGADGASTTLTAAGTGTSITLDGARGGWNKITPW